MHGLGHTATVAKLIAWGPIVVLAGLQGCAGAVPSASPRSVADREVRSAADAGGATGTAGGDRGHEASVLAAGPLDAGLPDVGRGDASRPGAIRPDAAVDAAPGRVVNVVTLERLNPATGITWFEVTADGAAVRRHQWHPDAVQHLRVSEAALGAIRAVAEQQECCRLRSTPTRGLVNRTVLTLEFPGLACRVELPDDDWSRNAHARPCRDAVLALEQAACGGPCRPPM